jgi:hypothetical protein
MEVWRMPLHRSAVRPYHRFGSFLDPESVNESDVVIQPTVRTRCIYNSTHTLHTPQSRIACLSSPSQIRLG